MKKLKVNFFHFKIKLIACFRIFFVHKHWFLICLDSENLLKLISEDDEYEVEVLYHGLVKYNVKKICKNAVSDMTDVDWILEKAQFEAEADLYNSSK